MLLLPGTLAPTAVRLTAPSLSSRLRVPLSGAVPAVRGGFPMRRGRIVPFLAISPGRTVLDTAFLVRGRGPGSLGATVGISGAGTAVSGGARYYFQPPGRRVRGFLSVASGHGRVVADLSIYDGWSRGRVSTTPVHAPLYGGPALGSTVGSVAIVSDLGVDLRVTDPLPLRIAGGLSLGFPDGGPSTSVGLRTSVCSAVRLARIQVVLAFILVYSTGSRDPTGPVAFSPLFSQPCSAWDVPAGGIVRGPDRPGLAHGLSPPIPLPYSSIRPTLHARRYSTCSTVVLRLRARPRTSIA